jgi:mannose-6-phosphate isomerase-like protein (cupin superfamily)
MTQHDPGYSEMSQVVRGTGGTLFELEKDLGRLIVSSEDTRGRYSLMEWTVAAETERSNEDGPDYGAHLHRECEETFLITSGSLEFLLGDEVVTLHESDFVRVAAGQPHGYRNVSGEAVKMLVSFVPAGLEELFVKYRTDQEIIPGEGFVCEATRRFASEFDLQSPSE